EMHVRAIARAAQAVEQRTGAAPLVEIMHPLVGFAEELRRLRELTVRTVAEEGGIEYLCGTMIELPRAALRADEIAEHADFFSFGTNDLTQTALGMSRDDAEGKFLTFYLEDGVLERNPFETLDRSGVGDLMRIAIERGRSTKEDIKLGICGEHGGDPGSVHFCHELGLGYVSRTRSCGGHPFEAEPGCGCGLDPARARRRADDGVVAHTLRGRAPRHRHGVGLRGRQDRDRPRRLQAAFQRALRRAVRRGRTAVV